MPLIHARFPHGEVFPILTGEDGLPDTWVNTYLAIEKRPHLRFNSLRNCARNLDHLRTYERARHRDFSREFAHGKFPSAKDVRDLRDHCWLPAGQSSVPAPDSRKRKRRSDIAVPPVPELRERVGAEHAAHRMQDIRSFLRFLAETIQRRNLGDPKIRRAIDDMDRSLATAVPKAGNDYKFRDPSTKAPAPPVFFRFLTLADPEHPDNPWRGISRTRNSLMFKVLIATGLRLGELLCLQTGDHSLDLTATRPAIHVRKLRDKDRALDSRRSPPGQKTIERTIFITQQLATEIDAYIKGPRRDAVPARKHGFLFVNHRRGESWGAPMSYAAWESAISVLKTTDPSLLGGVRAHGFRHTYAYLLNKRIDAYNEKLRATPVPGKQPMNEKQRQQVLMEVMGWTDPNSAQPYLRRYIKEEVDAMTMQRMEEMTKFVYFS